VRASGNTLVGSHHPNRLRAVATTGLSRTLLLGITYSGAILVAHWLAFLIRFEFHPGAEFRDLYWRTMIWMLPGELLALMAFGQFRSLLSYFSLPDARRILLASASIGIVSLIIWYSSDRVYAPPRSIIVLAFLLDAAAICNVRLAFRSLRERQRSKDNSNRPLRRMVVVGAGDVGASLIKEMKSRRDLRMFPVALFDDDRAKWSTHLHGVPIVGRPELLIGGKFRADEAILAMPSASGKRIREIVQIFNEAHLRFETVPSIEQLVNGEVRASQIRPVQLEDLLGRDLIKLEMNRILDVVQGRNVLVTGAGGSIGSELCRQILKYSPKRLLIVERCEVQMFLIEQELIGLGCKTEIVALVADVLDDNRMREIFERYKPELLFHAAAHKHVPLMESQPYEAFQNNTIGTKKLAKLSVEYLVERFVLISTDKAINPTNAMGATKRLAELFLQAIQKHNGNRTRFMAVRFGNVLGSSGSVIPTFKRQIAAGGPITVTHPEVTRYFMTVQEAVGLVLQSATQGEGGEIFVLDMGKLIKIVDVARQLVELSGLKPDIDIEIQFTGLRPGEKLFEEINLDSECMIPTEHPKIKRFMGHPLPFEELSEGILRIQELGVGMDGNQLKREFQTILPEYKPCITAI